jgi:hypothetical protein
MSRTLGSVSSRRNTFTIQLGHPDEILQTEKPKAECTCRKDVNWSKKKVVDIFFIESAEFDMRK